MAKGKRINPRPRPRRLTLATVNAKVDALDRVVADLVRGVAELERKIAIVLPELR